MPSDEPNSSVQAGKRAFDLAVSVGLLVPLIPVMTGIGVLIRATSPGPILYRGVRSGKDGKPFEILKFRTMVPNAENLGGGTTALDDRRVTMIGRFLRRYKLDELPQLFNVIKGDMSLVGPRPELPQYTSLYKGDEKLILSVRPGVTDLASIEFNALDECVGAEGADRVYEEKILPRKNALRLQYVREHSFGSDLVIIWRTVASVLGKAKRK